MPRALPIATLQTRTQRLKLPVSSKPLFVTIGPGLGLGYRRNARGAGNWVVRGGTGADRWTKNLGPADDYAEADGIALLSFWQAQTSAREFIGNATESNAESAPATAPVTVGLALDRYAADLSRRQHDTGNASRLRVHLPKHLLDRPVTLLTERELKAWHDGLVDGELAPATVNRLVNAFKAVLNLAARTDRRIAANRDAWEIGLTALEDAEEARNIILDDGQVRAIIAAAYADSLEFGLFIDTAAMTGARTSQLARLDVVDLQDGAAPRLMMPVSRKGRGQKKRPHHPVPITAGLASRLRAAAAGRGLSAPLLVKPPYQPEGRPNGGRTEVIWTPERIARAEALAAPDGDGGTRPLSEIARLLGVTKGSLAGLFQRRRQAAQPRPQRLPARRTPTRWGRWDHGRPFARVAFTAGCEPEVTIYALRHSSIARQLMARVPIRVVAADHDTSVAMIERNYARYIVDHAEHLVRAALLDTDIPAPGAEIIRLREHS
jgi:integrase